MSPPFKILVVEDEAVVAMDIRAQLEGLGYEVVGTPSTAEEGVALVASTPPDLVLMDIQLAGDRDGISAAEQIGRDTGTPVVFLTAFADEATLARANEASPYGYIVKPFDGRDLRTTIEIALSRSRTQRELESSHEDLTAILDAQRQGAIAVDGEGRVTFVSQAAKRLLGRSMSDLVGVRWQAALPIDRTILDRIHRLAFREGAEEEKISAEIDADGLKRTVEFELVDDPRSEGRFFLFLYDVSEVHELRSMLDRESVFEKLIGSGTAMRAVFQLIREVAVVDSPVLIQGETGTGKELVARAIHRRSGRQDKPFIPVNCGALTPELAASQLFGHRRGAFTGAISDHEGFFRAAHNGTLFLDEIGELPISVQPALLRALDDRQIAPVGETRTREVDFRLIAATSRALDQEIDRRDFRSDLYYRLSVVRLVLPPLRERLEDLPALVRAFLSEARAKTGKDVREVTSEAMSILLDYSWPGNVRQLRNAMEFAAIRSRGQEVASEFLPPEIRSPVIIRPESSSEADRIRAALAQTRGNRRRAAELLGMSRSTFYRRLKSLELEP